MNPTQTTRAPVGIPTQDSGESSLGLRRFLTSTPGTGGRLKSRPEDFVVDEVPLAFPKPVKDGKYTIASIRARNWETNRLMREIAQRLRISRAGIFFAGTKDKRAVTTQYVAIRAPEEAVRALDIRDVEILETLRVDRAPKIGELVGNRFHITLRQTSMPIPQAHAAAQEALAQIEAYGGFPNYFGLQRFGVLRPVTHAVGRKILEGDLQGAVHAYVGHPVPTEQEDARVARAAFDADPDPAAALARFPHYMSFERTLLEHLRKHPGDHAGALLALPRNLLTMFVYAYQSFLFNETLSLRMERGIPLNAPLVGDYVFARSAAGVPDRERAIEVTTRNLDKVTRRVREGKAFVTGAAFGLSVQLAGGEMGEIEEEVAARWGVTREMFRVPHLPEAASPGVRRELLAQVGDMAVSSDEDDGALRLRFFLSKGTYATCLLREVMKSPSLAYG